MSGYQNGGGMLLKWGSVVLVAAVGIGVFVWSKQLDGRAQAEREAERKAVLAQQEEEAQALSIRVDSNVPEEEESFISAADVLDGSAQGEILVDAAYAAENMSLISANRDGEAKGYLHGLDLEVKSSDLLILQLRAYTLESTATLEVEVDGVSTTLYLSQNAVDYYIPITDVEAVREISFAVTTDYHATVIDSVYLVNYAGRYDIDEVMTGAWTVDERSVLELSEEDSFNAVSVLAEDGSASTVSVGSMQVLVLDDVLYSIGDDVLRVYQIISEDVSETSEEASDSEEETSALSQIAVVDTLTGACDMAFSEDEDLLIITAGDHGMYLLDLTDPVNPVLLSDYMTEGSAAGLDVDGTYIYVSCGSAGIEVVDISDPEEPEQIAVVQTASASDYRDCHVDGQYLYAAAYGQRRVDIYDLSDPSESLLTAQIETDGAAMGLTVQDGMLYVATGRNSRNTASDVYDYGTGTGNGLEIYDVSDPGAPVYRSCVKANGRMSYAGWDVWDVQVSNGYAYVTDSLNGLMVYDISDSEMPVCVQEVRIITQESDDYDLTEDVFPWDTSDSGRGAVYHAAIENGRIWVASPDDGIFLVEGE